MNRFLRALMLVFPLLFLPATVFPQTLAPESKNKLDALVSQTYQAAAAEMPCKIKTRGRHDMMRWEEVDRCVNDAAAKVDWAKLLKDLTDARSEMGLSPTEFAAAVDASLAAHSLAFNKVFAVKEEKALLPLTNSLLRFLAPDALQDLPVIDRLGSKVGTFAGVFSFERTGGLAAANTYKLVIFQYTDNKGNNQPAPDKLLLDSFGVPWKDAGSQRGFRLPSDKLNLRR